MGDQLCSLKTAYLFVQNQPDVKHVIMSMSPVNEMNFLWKKFIESYNIEVVWDGWNAGDWHSRWQAWDQWRTERKINGKPFDHYRELYLRIHGYQRQVVLCGSERGLGRKNIYEYWLAGQENKPDTFPGADWFDDTLIHHPPHTPERDVYISPHCKTQGNFTFTFEYWSQVVHKLIDAGLTVTVGYDGQFCEELNYHPLYRKFWGTHEQWMEEVCKHKIVACGNTGTGWLAAACGVPLFTMEPPNSQMPDHRYRQCGLKNIVEVMDIPDSDYCAKRLIEETQRVVVMTTGCYDVIHAGHIRHLEKSRAMGSKLIVALNSDESVRMLKGPQRPINPQDQRKTVLEALRCVDEVRIFDGENAIPLIKEIKPAILTCGYGYNPARIIGKHLVESWGGKAVVTCENDGRDEPSTTKIIRKVLRSGDIIEICRVGAAHSVNPFEKLRLMAEEFLKVTHLEGSVADLGTYRGGTALILHRLAPDKHIHLFDTWQGNPFDDPLCHHKKGEWAAPLEDCKTLVGTDSFTHYHPGVFPTDADFDDKPAREEFFCFVYIDMDTYQSTMDALKFFFPLLLKGGKLFIDDYGWEPCAGVKKAVDEYFPPEECLRYGHPTTGLIGVPLFRVVQPQYTCIIERI